MSWQASERVHKDGPADAEMWRLLALIAYRADEHGENAHVDRRTIMEVCHVGNRRAVSLVNKAISEGWLVITKPGDKRRATTYALGVMAAQRGHSGRAAPTDRGHRMAAPRTGTAARNLEFLNSSTSAPLEAGAALVPENHVCSADAAPVISNNPQLAGLIAALGAKITARLGEPDG